MKAFFQILFLAVTFTPGLAFTHHQTLFNELQRDGVLRVELELDLATLESHVRTKEEQPAVFRFTDKQGAVQEWSADVNVRGRFRRSACAFPPIKIDFSKKDLEARGLQPFDDFKLVTHCQEGEEGEEAVLREYLAYKLYGKLTPLNFRAQLVEVTYTDTGSDVRFTKYGILLEDADELAARMNSEECDDCYGLTAARINPESYHTNALFQYMIGNADWSLRMARNLKIMKSEDQEDYWITPYDFDFSGLVDADYAVPNQDVGQKFVGHRVYMGTTADRVGLEKTIQHFQSQKDELLRCVETFSLLSKRSRKQLARYLENFYDSLGEDGFLERVVTSSFDFEAPTSAGERR